MIQKLLFFTGLLLLTYSLNAQFNSCIDGARIEIKGGGTEFFIPASELGSSQVLRVSTRPLVTVYAYLVTDENNTILKVSTSNFIDIADLGAGSFRIWAFSYGGDITAEIGQDAGAVQLASLCSKLTDNFITINIDSGNVFKVQILHHNDGESNLIGNDHFGGVARFQQIIDEQRFIASQGGYFSLLFSAGDNYLAGPEFTASLRRLFIEPMYDGLAHSEFGYDAIALGNHDFDFGPDILAEYIRSTDPAYQPGGVDTTIDIGRLEFLNDFSLPTQLEFAETVFGGISSIDYDAASGVYYLISDAANDARFYTATIEVGENGISDVNIQGVTKMRTPSNELFSDGSLDPEAIRYDGQTNSLIWTSEGFVNSLVDPFVREMDLNGNYLNEFVLPSIFSPDTINNQGPRQNGVFEGITLTVDGSEVITMTELPLKQDGVAPTLDPTSSPARMLFFDRNTGQATRQLAYPLDPIARGGNIFQVNGAVEILAYNEDLFLVMERSAFFDTAGSGNIVRIFKVDISGATDITNLTSLEDAEYEPVEKELLITIDDSFPLSNPVDNIEGMTFGPTLPNGNPTLILVADDNFSSFGPQLNQFMAFEVFLQTVPEDGTATNGAPPFISANLDFSGEPALLDLQNQGRIRSSTRVFRGSEPIGIIGLTTPELNLISAPRNVEIFSNLADIVEEEVVGLKSKGVNKIFLISHLQGIDEEIELIGQIKDVDIVIAGGGDEFLTNNPANDTIAGFTDLEDVRGAYPLEFPDANGETVYLVTAPGGYSYLGNLTVTFNEAGKVIEIDSVSGPKKVVTDKPDEDIQASIVEPVEDFVASLENNIIGITQPELNGVRGDVRTKETNAGNLIADAILWQANLFAPFFEQMPAQVAIQNGGGIRNSVVIPANGQISEFATFRMLPFPNFVTIVEPIPATQFKQIMERAVSQVENVRGQFAQIAGFRIVYDPSGQAQEIDENGNIVQEGQRIVNITLDNGTPIVLDGLVVEDAPQISIATIDFLARGGDGYPFGEASFTSIGVSYQQALASYIIANLGGSVSAEQYPEGGEGRIKTVDELGFIAPRLGNQTIGDVFELQAIPNPVIETLNVRYKLTDSGLTKVYLTDLSGTLIADIFNGYLDSGAHQLNINISDFQLASGAYLVTVQQEGFLQSIRFVK